MGIAWSEPRKRNVPLSNLQILAIEDEPIIAMDVETNLEALSASVYIALSAEGARSLMATRRFDAAICDFKLSEGTAEDIARELVAKGIPVMFYAAANPDIKIAGKTVPWLPKPATEADLRDAVRSILGLSPHKV
jgi:CheY-like chemotaxis protein